MAKPVKKIGAEHKRDIKVIYPQRNIGATVTIYGFESYERTVVDGKAVKTIVPNVPLAFHPGMDSEEDGYPVAFVSDTANNRRILAELVASNFVSCDNEVVEAAISSKAEPEQNGQDSAQDQLEARRMLEKTKAELMSMAEAAGVAVTADMTKAQIVEAITGKVA